MAIVKKSKTKIKVITNHIKEFFKNFYYKKRYIEMKKELKKTQEEKVQLQRDLSRAEFLMEKDVAIQLLKDSEFLLDEYRKTKRALREEIVKLRE